MASSSSSALWKPIRIGAVPLKHRIVLAPLTRNRANAEHVHGDLAVEYYEQRASEPGTLLITEATFIAQKAGGQPNIPGVWSQAQFDAWRRVTDAVHAKGSFIFLQLWALGRAAFPDQLGKEGNFPYVTASDVQMSGQPKPPRPLTKEEITEYVQLYATAAKNSVHGAGFDGVEIHAANGYLIDQFLQTNSNKRTDEYGGSIENCVRFGLEVVDAVVKAVGEDRTAIRLSPWSTFQDMRMDDPIPTFSHFITELKNRYPNLAYLHMVEPVIAGDNEGKDHKEQDSNDFARDIWRPKPLLSCGGHTPENAPDFADKQGDVIVFGRLFLANPDLPKRIRNALPLNKPNRDTFYKPESPEGYIDYPFAAA